MDKNRIRAAIDSEIGGLDEEARKRIIMALGERAERQAKELANGRAEMAAKEDTAVPRLPGKSHLSTVRKIWLIAAVLLALTIGTVLALSIRSGFTGIYEGRDLEILQRNSQPVYMEDRQGDVSLVLEEILNVDGRFLISVGLVNHGETPWVDGYYGCSPQLEVAGREESLFEDVFGGSGALSDDGRRLAFKYDGYSETDLNGSQIRISLENIERTDQIHRQANIPLADFFDEEYLPVTYNREEVGTGDEQDVSNLYRNIPKREPLIVHEDIPHSYISAAAFVERGVLWYGDEELDAGFVFFLEFPGAENGVDYVSVDMMELETETYGSRNLIKFPGAGNDGKEIMAYFLPGFTREHLTEYGIGGIMSFERVLVEEGRWQLLYQIEQGKVGISQPLDGEAEHRHGGYWIRYEGEAVISPLGIRIIGRAENDPWLPGPDWLDPDWYDFDVHVWTKTGEELPLQTLHINGFDENWDFAVEYILETGPSNPQHILDMDTIDFVIIGGVRIGGRGEQDE